MALKFSWYRQIIFSYGFFIRFQFTYKLIIAVNSVQSIKENLDSNSAEYPLGIDFANA